MPRVVTSLIDHATRGPLTADLRDLVAGPSHTFFVSWPCHLSANEIMALLDKRGITSWGYCTLAAKDEMMFTVRQVQARWAQYTLERAGVPIKPGGAYCASSVTGGGRLPLPGTLDMGYAAAINDGITPSGNRFLDRLLVELERGINRVAEVFGGDLLKDVSEMREE
jgi:hypothetical protein